MKFATALLALISCTAVHGQALVNSSDGQRLLALQHTATCMQQEQSTVEAALSLVRGQFAGLDRNAKCFANCFLERVGLLLNGAAQPAAISAQLSLIVGTDRANEIMAECNRHRGSDNCETAFVMYECYFKQNAAII